VEGCDHPPLPPLDRPLPAEYTAGESVAGGDQPPLPLEATVGAVAGTLFEDDAAHCVGESTVPNPFAVVAVGVSPPGATVPAVCVTSFSPPNSMAEDFATSVAASSTADARGNRLGAIADDVEMTMNNRGHHGGGRKATNPVNKHVDPLVLRTARTRINLRIC
jgi:hypothetical protein